MKLWRLRRLILGKVGEVYDEAERIGEGQLADVILRRQPVQDRIVQLCRSENYGLGIRVLRELKCKLIFFHIKSPGPVGFKRDSLRFLGGVDAGGHDLFSVIDEEFCREAV